MRGDCRLATLIIVLLRWSLGQWCRATMGSGRMKKTHRSSPAWSLPSEMISTVLVINK